MSNGEKEFMGGKKSKMWTYLILGVVIVVGVLVANFALSNPGLAKNGVKSFLGMPGWAFPTITFVIGVLVFWLGLKVETDWPEALGAAMIAGSVATGQIMIGWSKFALGGIAVLPYIIPVLIFFILLMVGMAKSR
jgi:hypothetical protein